MDETKPTERRLAAIMFSDICGYSRRMGENEERALGLLAQHDKMIEAAVAEFGGHIIKRMGDGVLAEFQSAVRSVECALSIQRRIARWNRDAPEPERFQLRIGVHLGDVMVSGEDILGDGVNIASRIEPLALPGGICISQDVFNQVHRKVEMEAVSLGPQQLKNIQRQIEIYRVLTAAVGEVPPVTRVDATTDPRAATTHRWLTLALVGTGVLLLFLVLVTANRTRRHREVRTVHAALEQASGLMQQGQPAEARAVLQASLRQVRPKTPGLDEVRTAMAAAERAETESAVAGRAREFLQALLSKDWNKCVEFMHPDSKMQIGVKGLRGRMQLLGFFGGILAITDKDIEITKVTLAEDLQSATVMQRARVKGQWKEENPQTWRRSDGAWYLFLEQ
ncbi:MAG: hypothetical protein A3K19_20080 [Lentisphaerae bacterium RIFOXYB12_FULL_65_16]|nr:MAG: hypothetical protein A3K18_11160 [Lentisphaerae bacterium RIFOXYA12_64_32]OGV91761.1 MAG: hypothetical protein A3K19_20080 [Lentisphaerae bacterium RIFOXYB12_FULL_65_16]